MFFRVDIALIRIYNGNCHKVAVWQIFRKEAHHMCNIKFRMIIGTNANIRINQLATMQTPNLVNFITNSTCEIASTIRK